MSKFILSFAFILFAQSAVASLCTDRCAEIKAEIISISRQNTTNEADFAITREKLDALVAELEEISGPVTESTVGQFSPGSWKQIFSDEKNNDVVGGPQRDLNQIYQYVNAAGWAFNFGVRTLPTGQQVTFALKVAASVIGNEQRTEITAAFLRMTPIRTNESIDVISQQIYEGTSIDFVQRQVGNFPRGPIGAVGILNFKYIDEDVKIGTTNNVFTGTNELFVMERM